VLVLGQLKLCLGLEGHILNASLVFHVFLVDLIDLELSVGTDLCESLLVILSDLSDVVAERLSGILGSLHVLAELLQLLRDTLVMLFNDAIHLLLVFMCLLLLLSLQLLIVGGIGEHLL